MLKALLALVMIAYAFAGIDAARGETRVALVVGNAAYRHTTPLANPRHDAADVAAALRTAGFVVVEAVDADRRGFDEALRTFTQQLVGAEVALFYYAGHGLQVGLQNYLVPIDAKLERERDLEFEAVRLEFVLRQMEIDREGKTSIVMLDACRDNPLARNLARTMGTRSAAVGRGLAAAATGLGTFIAYSTQPGNVALDGDGRNSPFTAALLGQIGVKGRNLPATMIEVRKAVVAATGGKQVPWDHSALTGDFYFTPDRPGGEPAALAAAPAGASAEVAALQERLRRLEEDSRNREMSAPKATAPVAALPPVVPRMTITRSNVEFDLKENVRLDGLKISEQRQPSPAACRLSCEQADGCIAFQHGRRAPVMGQCQLYSRIDARYEDASWRSGVRTDAFEPATATATATAASRIPLRVDAKPTRRENDFDIYEGTGAVGTAIKMSATDSPAGCQVVCRNTPGCVVATYNEFFRGKNVACQVFRDMTDVIKQPTATMMVRRE